MARLAAAAALEREQVRVVAIAAQAQIRPPDVIATMGMEDELGVGQLHHSRAQFVSIVVHVDHLTGRERESVRTSDISRLYRDHTQYRHTSAEISES